MIKVFEDYFLKTYSQEDLQNLKLITKSLLFSLIPLHNNEKCQKYYDLIKYNLFYNLLYENEMLHLFFWDVYPQVFHKFFQIIMNQFLF